MNARDLEKLALEFLAVEYERDGKTGSANHIRTQPLLPNKARAVRAIVAALRQQPAPVVDDARMARVLEWVRALAKPCSAEEREMLNSIEEAIAAYDPNCGARTVRVVDDELPGMWSQSDFMGGAADAADDASQLVPSVDDAMVDRYLAAQAKAVQEIDDALGNGGKAASYLHPVREACRAGLTAALTAARAQGVQP